MNDYIFINGNGSIEFVTKVSAENIKEAKKKYAEEIWKIDNFRLEVVESRTVNESFWEKYLINLISSRDGSWLHEINKTKKIFKTNLEKDFSPEIADKLIDYFFNREKSIEKLTDKARLDVAKVQVQNLLDDNFLRIYPLDEMRSIS